MNVQEFNNRLMTYENSLKYFALNLTRDPEIIRDLVQDTYLKAIQYRDKFTLDSNFKAWLFTILKNTYLNQIARLSYKNTINDESEDFYIIKNTFRENENAESIINISDISFEINSLEKEYRIPFQMFLDGYKYKEIAEEINLPIGTIKSRIFFARKILMERLQGFV